MGALGVPQTLRRSYLIAHSFTSSYAPVNCYYLYILLSYISGSLSYSRKHIQFIQIEIYNTTMANNVTMETVAKNKIGLEIWWINKY
jgi:hypothetical protein